MRVVKWLPRLFHRRRLLISARPREIAQRMLDQIEGGRFLRCYYNIDHFQTFFNI